MYKDEILAKLSERANVAQFVSFDPSGNQRFARIRGYENDHSFKTILEAAKVMLANSPERSVNVRSFEPENPKSREFIYGITDADDVACHVIRLGEMGLYTIVNETVDVNDGGVSGVAMGDLIEFAPGDTPRCVEKPGTLQLTRNQAFRLFEIVYGFTPSLGYPANFRVEFSIHPLPRGVMGDHTIVWEAEEIGYHETQAVPVWPNKFSRLVGDKAFGLLMAYLLGLPVPRTTVIARDVAPFSFGVSTQSGETWIRTCPRVQTPGKFSTFRGWRDPFAMIADEDPKGEFLAGVIAMDGVKSAWSGAVITQADGTPLIEGKAGFGDDFMLGQQVASVPEDVELEVLGLYERARARTGDVRMEWAYDGKMVWVVQFHRGKTSTQGNVIYPGTPERWMGHFVEDGLESLRILIQNVNNLAHPMLRYDAKGMHGERAVVAGIAVIGQVGITSHVGDVLRKAEIPAVVVASEDDWRKLPVATLPPAMFMELQ